jgi:polyhydroxyalkanoate synthesis regulator phasin
VVTQGSFILSTYANDQLQQDLARDKLVAAGEMTQDEADEAAEEWESVSKKWKP